ATFTTPSTPLFGTPMRVRIIDEKSSFDITDACDAGLQRGQCEDYMVYFPVPCAIPSGLSVTNITTSSAILNWPAVTSAIKYKVRYKVTGNNPWTTFTTTTNSATVTGLTANTSYTWKVGSICGTNPTVKSDYSANSEFKTSAGKFAADADNSSFEIYPNPT